MELTLNLSESTVKTVGELMEFYHFDKPAEVIKKSLALLSVACHVKKTQGELIGRSPEGQETQILT